MLVNAMKLVHPQKELVITCKAKHIYNAAMKKKELQFYEYISFIRNYLENYWIKAKIHSQRKTINKVPKKKPNKNIDDEEPEITKLVSPDEYEVIEGFFTRIQGHKTFDKVYRRNNQYH